MKEKKQKIFAQIILIFDKKSEEPSLVDKIDYYESGTYFDKLRSVVSHRLALQNTKQNLITPTSDNVLENLVESIRSSPVSECNTTMIRCISLDKRVIRSIERKTVVHFLKNTFSMSTVDGDIIFDFSKQPMDYTTYLHLMQLVIENEDLFKEEIMQWIVILGEYHHIDYKEYRRQQLTKDEEILKNIIRPLKSFDPNKRNSDLTMAKAVHFRTATNYFVLEGVNISSHFQYDRKVIEDACRRFHDNIKSDASTQGSNTTDLTDTKQMICRIVVLCSHRLRDVYRLFELLFKSYISSNISIIYVTFDQMKSLFTKHEISLEADVVNDKNETNEEHLLDCFRTSALILIFMKHFDESYLTSLIQWYTAGTDNSDLSNTFHWNRMIEHWWLITGDYQRSETLFNIPRSNLFLWPTDHHDLDNICIIISSILALPIALTINYQNYSMILTGMSVVDRHCQETRIEENVCLRMALHRIRSNGCGKQFSIASTYNDNNLHHFNEYVQAILTEYEETRMTDELTTKSPENDFSYDIITIRGLPPKPNLNNFDQISSSQSQIILDQLTPLTFGALMGVYQVFLFFENIIRQSDSFRVYKQNF